MRADFVGDDGDEVGCVASACDRRWQMGRYTNTRQQKATFLPTDSADGASMLSLTRFALTLALTTASNFTGTSPLSLNSALTVHSVAALLLSQDSFRAIGELNASKLRSRINENLSRMQIV